MIRHIHLCAFAGITWMAVVILQLVSFGTAAADGIAVVLTNDRVSVDISTAHGGVIHGLQLHATQPVRQDALTLHDQIVVPGSHRLDWPTFEIVEQSSASVTLRGRLPAATSLGTELLAREQQGFAYRSRIRTWPRTEDITVEKTYTLMPDSARIVVRYRFTNTGSADLDVCLLHAVSLAEGVTSRLSFHGWRGATTWSVPMSPKATDTDPHLAASGQASVYDVASSWLAWQHPDAPTVAVWSAAAETSCLLVDAHGHGGIVRTEITLAANATWETSMQIMLAPQGPAVTHVEPGLVASLAAPQAAPLVESRQATITSTAPTDNPDDLDYLDLTDIEKEVASSTTAELPPPTTLTMDLRFTDPADNSRTIRFGLRARGGHAWTWQDTGATLLATREVEQRPTIQVPRAGAYDLRVQIDDTWSLQMPLQVQHFGGWLPAEGIVRRGRVYRGFRYPGLPRPSFEAEADWQPTTDVVTDHVALGRPLSQGPLRVLAIVPYWQVRDVVGLALRMDLDLTTLVIGRNGYREKYTGYYDSTDATAPIDEQDRLRQLLAEPYDAIIMVNLYGTWFPPELMDEVGRQVDEDGVGLLIVGDMDVFGRLETAIATHSGPTGRVVQAPGRYADATTPIIRNEATAQALCRQLLQVARGHAPLLQRDPVVPQAVQVADWPLAIEFARSAGAVAGVRLTVRRDLLANWPFYGAVQLRDRQSETWEVIGQKQDMSIVDHGGKLHIPPLPAGKYSVDIQYLDAKGGVIDWQRHALSVTTPPATATVHAEKSDRPATLRIRIESTHRLDTDEVYLTAIDPTGRLLASRLLQPTEIASGFDLYLPASRHPLVILRTRVTRDGRPVSEDRSLATITSVDRASPFDLRGFTEVTVNPTAHEYTTRVGGNSPATFAWLDLQKSDYGNWVPEAEFIATPNQLTAPSGAGEPTRVAIDAAPDITLDEPGVAGLDTPGAWVRSPCLNDPIWRQQQIGKLIDYYQSMSQTGPYRGFAVDEWFYYKEPQGRYFRRDFSPGRHTNICRSPHCLAKFRTFARARFADDLSRLNATWGTRFASWQDVAPPLIDPASSRSPTEATWPWILAHREFVDQQLPELLADYRQAVKQVDPGCETGMSGVWPTGIWNGLDIYQLAQHAHYNMVYSQPELWISFGAANVCRWGGYSQKYSPAVSATVPWKTLFDGMDTYGYYGKFITPMYHSDGRYMDGPAALFQSVATMRRRGLDRLFIHNRTQDPVAIYYSPRDIYLASLREWRQAPDDYSKIWQNAGRAHSELPRASASAIYDSLSQDQFQVGWLANQQLQAGTLSRPDGTRLRLLYLPGAESLSDAQVQTLIAFVTSGGILVADLRPGTRDEHGRQRSVGALDNLFGVRPRAVAGEDLTAPAQLRLGDDAGEIKIPIPHGGSIPLALDQAQAWASLHRDGNTSEPAFIVNAVGDGFAVLLNLVPSALTTTEIAGVEGEEQEEIADPREAAHALRRELNRVWRLADLPLAATVSPWVRCARFQAEGATILGLRTSLSDWDRPIELTLPEPRHAYDSLRGSYLGHADHFTLQPDPTAVAPIMIISLSPTRIDPITLSPANAAMSPGDSLRLEANTGNRTASTVGFSVYGPDGQELRHYRQSSHSASPSSLMLDLPLNATPGIWRVVATHSLSGYQATAHITVAKRSE